MATEDLPRRDAHDGRIQVRAASGARPLDFGKGPSLSSKATPWAGPQLEVHGLRPRKVGAVTGPPPGEQGLLVVVSGSADIHQREGRRCRFEGRPGAACFVSGRYPRFVERIEGRATAVAIKLDEAHFHGVGLEGPPATFGLSATGADTTILSLVQAMVHEVQAGAACGRVFAESLSTALLAYLLRDLPGGPGPSTARGRLSSGQARRVRDYIEGHLTDDLSLSDLAAEVHMSPRRFTEAFRFAFDSSPHQYILRRRVGAAMERLARGSDSLETIAEEVGFSSASHLSRAFRRLTGSAPRRYARVHLRR